MSNLSNAPFTPTQQNPLSSYSTVQLPNFNQFSTDQNAIAQEGAAVTTQFGGGVLVYPADPPKYIMTFSVQNYNRSSYNAVGQFQTAGYPGIVMPLPSELANLSESKWEEQDSGLLSLAAAGIGALTGGIGGRQSAAQTAANQGLTGLAAATGGAAATAAQAFLGATPNQFQVMLYRGPSYKQFEFTWTVSPQNFQELDILRQICLVFQNAMAPTIVTIGGSQVGRALWGFPCIFRIRLYPNSKWMQKFKPAVCTQFTVHYTPTGKPSFYRNTNGVNGDNPPESMTIKAKFMEMEYWIAGNYTSDNDPDSQEDPENIITRPLEGDAIAPGGLIAPSAGGGATTTLP